MQTSSLGPIGLSRVTTATVTFGPGGMTDPSVLKPTMELPLALTIETKGEVTSATLREFSAAGTIKRTSRETAYREPNQTLSQAFEYVDSSVRSFIHSFVHPFLFGSLPWSTTSNWNAEIGTVVSAVILNLFVTESRSVTYKSTSSAATLATQAARTNDSNALRAMASFLARSPTL